jgi:hypothetical protein
MWYFRNVLVLPDVRAAMETKEKKEDTSDPDAVTKEKKDPFGFIKNIFKKKNKDSTAMLVPTIDESNSSEDTPKRESKNKKPKKEKKEEVKKEPAKKDEDDGF